MRCMALGAGLLVLTPWPTHAQDTVPAPASTVISEPLTFGVGGALGFPLAMGTVRLSAPLGPKAGIDFAVGRLAGGRDSLGRPFLTHVRWMRGGRKPSGDSRYWIVGAMLVRYSTSTLVIFPGHVRRYMGETRTLAIPRFGYGWDHLTRRGMRAGVELTTGAAGEEAGFLFANAFLMWGPPRR
jgi:hypothetical protein